MADADRVTIESGVVYGTGGGRDLCCDVFTPPGEVEDAPAVVLVHGGGWRNGDPTQLRGYGVLLGRKGYVCIAPEYRLLGESPWPAQIEDVKAAVRWVRANATKLGIDPSRIAIEGNSAGAHLALLVAGTVGVEAFEGEGGNPGVSTEVAAVLAVYAPTLLLSSVAGQRGAVPWAAISGEESLDLASAASPLTHAKAGFPPTLLIHGTGDTVVPPLASIRMYEDLLAADVPVELHMYAEQPHGFDAAPEYGRQCAAEMLLFLGRYLPAREPAA